MLASQLAAGRRLAVAYCTYGLLQSTGRSREHFKGVITPLKFRAVLVGRATGELYEQGQSQGAERCQSTGNVAASVDHAPRGHVIKKVAVMWQVAVGCMWLQGLVFEWHRPC
jgi:hypothetical protein